MEKEPEANRPSSERFWLGHITRCQEQNLSMAKYASEHGLKAGKLYYWKKRLKAPGQLPSHPKPVTFSRVQPAANLYSLIETAKANGLEPYHYLRYLFNALPLAQNLDQIEALLPYNVSVELLSITGARKDQHLAQIEKAPTGNQSGL